MNARGLCPVVLEAIEVGATGFIQRENLTIDYRVVRETRESFEDQGILTIEGISPSGKQIRPAARFHGDGTVPIELDLVLPGRPSRERRDRETLHGLSECSCAHWERIQCLFEVGECHEENKDGWRSDGRGSSMGGKPLLCQILLNCSIVAGEWPEKWLLAKA